MSLSSNNYDIDGLNFNKPLFTNHQEDIDVCVSEPPRENININSFIKSTRHKIVTPNRISYVRINKIINSITIAGENFLIEKEDETIYLTHPKWSLVGMGENLMEAEKDLILEAKDLFNSIKSLPISPDNLELREFLFNII